MMSDYGTFLQFAIHLALSAGQVIREGAQGKFTMHSKGLRDFVTDVDLETEQTIVQAIRNRYPEHDILTEESPPTQRTSRYRWVIDPLDGTGNFVHRYPCFSTSIALTCDDEPIAGVVYDPIRDDLFAAKLGGGATLNGKLLRVSQTKDFIDTMIGMDWTRDEKMRAEAVRVIDQLTLHCDAIRTCGSAALGLCYVGAGWWDAYFHLQLQPWDAAAGTLIICEAGGQVTNASGEPWRLDMAQCLASNERLHAQFCTYVRMGIKNDTA